MDVRLRRGLLLIAALQHGLVAGMVRVAGVAGDTPVTAAALPHVTAAFAETPHTGEGQVVICTPIRVNLAARHGELVVNDRKFLCTCVCECGSTEVRVILG